MKRTKTLLFMLTALVVLGVVIANKTAVSKNWDPAQLDAAQAHAQITGLELTLDLDKLPVGAAFTNNTDIALESGAAVGTSGEDIIFCPGLEVLLNDVWYAVPHEEFASAGIGLELAPGTTVSGRLDLSQYGNLPDGQYRALYMAHCPSSDQDYTACAGFAVQDGRCVPDR